MNNSFLKKRYYVLSVLLVGLLANLSVGILNLQAQEAERRESTSTVAPKTSEVSGDALINWNSWNMSVSPRFDIEYNSNIYRRDTSTVSGDTDDVILKPGVNFGFDRAISDFNNLSLDLNLWFDIYTKHSGINDYIPLVSPDSELAYHLFIGDTHLKFHESFSYQEDINSIYNLVGEYADIAETRFGRYENNLGVDADWDAGDFVVSGGFDWDWFKAKEEVYRYQDNNTLNFRQSVSYFLNPKFRTGLEFRESPTFYDQNTINSQFRLEAGPFLEADYEDIIKLKIGAGYSYGNFEHNNKATQTDDINDWYAYGSASHDFTDWLSDSLTVDRRHQISWNSDDRLTTSVVNTIGISLFRGIAWSLSGSYSFTEESGGQYDGSNKGDYTYWTGGTSIAYILLEDWKPSIRYNYYTYDRDSGRNDNYDVHQLTLSIQYSF